MKTIWKFELPIEGTIEMPIGAEILGVQVQRDEPRLWAMVDPSAPKEKRQFKIYGTGHTMPDNPGKYVGTFQIAEGTFIFHVFEKDQ